MRVTIPHIVRAILKEELERQLDNIADSPVRWGLSEAYFRKKDQRQEWAARIRLVRELASFLGVPLGRSDARLDEAVRDTTTGETKVSFRSWNEVLPQLETIIHGLDERDSLRRRQGKSIKRPTTPSA